ncbi:MAG: hypothetical protein GX344_04790 [Intrasporangiaceae bacterium]|nr:hypothetical protein [Intrasporangiaceae bacterium]
MGYSTTYIGQLKVEPPLNQAETAWLRAYCAADRGGADPYDVPLNPGADHLHTLDRPGALLLTVQDREGRYSIGRDWRPTVEGCHLTWVRAENSNDADRQIEYLIEHFLGPHARARHSERPEFAEFTFDHVVSGYAAGEGPDGRFTLIQVDRNEVCVRVLTAGIEDAFWGAASADEQIDQDG